MLINPNKPTIFTAKKTTIAVLITSLTILAGCNDGGGSSSGTPTPPPPVNPPVVIPPVDPELPEPPVPPPVVPPKPPVEPPVNPEPPVEPPVQPPASGNITLAPIDPISTQAGDEYKVQVNARQNDGAPLKYQLQPELPWVTIDSATGLITITPNNSALGQQTLRVLVTDGVSTKAEAFTIEVQRNTTKATLQFEIRNKEPNQWIYYDMYINGEKVKVSDNPNPEVPSSLYININEHQHSPEEVFANLHVGDLIGFEFRDMRMNQNCRMGEQDGKYTFTLHNTVVPVDIDCQTDAVLNLNSTAGSFYLDEGVIDTFPSRLINTDTDKIIANITVKPTMEYQSGNDAIVTFASQHKSEKITPVGLGTTKIVAEASPQLYRGDIRREYPISILDKNARKRLEFCQINCVDVYSKYQGLVGGRETLMRMYQLAGKYEFTVNNKDGAQLYTTNVTCTNPTGNNQPVYEPGKTCDVSVPGEFIMPNNQFVVTNSADSTDVFNVLPNIFPPQYLIVTLVRVRITSDHGYEYQSTYNYDPDNKTDAEVLRELETLLNDKFPFTKITLKERNAVFEYNIGGGTIQETSTWDKMMVAFRAMQNAELGGVVHASQNVYYGLAPMRGSVGGMASPGIGIGIDGYYGANRPSTSANGCSTDRCLRTYQQTMVHELGHTLGLKHAPCGSAPDASEDWQYAYWKEGPDSAKRPGGALSDSPLWVSSTKTLESPVLRGSTHTRDVMGYCNGFQFSELNTLAMLTSAYDWNKFGQPSTSTPVTKDRQQAKAVVASQKTITWFINNDGVVFNPLTLSGMSATSSDYSVVLTTNQGNKKLPVGATYLFDSGTTYYSVVLPQNETVHSFKLFSQNGELIYEQGNLDQPLPGTRNIDDDGSDRPIFYETKDAVGNITHSYSAPELKLRKRANVMIKDYFNAHRYQ